MKKIIALMFAAALSSSMAFAQGATSTTPAPATKKHAHHAAKMHHAHHAAKHHKAMKSDNAATPATPATPAQPASK